ncbi:MAG: hypothetical protein ABI459_00570, partial [Deltaproteobacteria bacterium]
MRATPFRGRFLLSTSLVTLAIGGYARRSYAACVGAAPTYLCSGVPGTGVQYNFFGTNTSVLVTTGTVFDTGALPTNQITISGDGALSFEAQADVSLTSTAVNGVFIVGNSGGAPTSIAVTTAAGSGQITGGITGITVLQYGTGAVTVAAASAVTGTIESGIEAGIFDPSNASGLSVSTGAGAVSGGSDGIGTVNYGMGALTITTEGDVTGTNLFGIIARLVNLNNASALSITSGTGAVSGGQDGIFTYHYGLGALTVTSDGDVTGTNGTGIYARISSDANASDLSITTGAGAVSGGQMGVNARQNGTGAVTIITEGEVTGTLGNGVDAQISNPTNASDLSITTGGGAVTGGNGILARHFGTGALTIITEGDVTGTTEKGIDARLYNVTNPSDLSITTGAGAVSGATDGIGALHYGRGALTITTEGDVTGTAFNGIYARLTNASNASDLSITTGAGAVSGGEDGIRARHYGTGALTITTEGDVTGTDRFGIYARMSYQYSNSAISITTGAGAVTGGQGGIFARQYGTGAVTITTEGDVTGTTEDGIYAVSTNPNAYAAITATTGAGAVTGSRDGIGARHEGRGAISITTDGDVTGTYRFGIYAQMTYEYNNAAIAITTGAGSVLGGQDGIRARHAGNGAVTITTEGDVTGTIGNGIDARISNIDNNYAISVTTGAGAVNGGQNGVLARNYGYGALSITTEGDVAGTTGNGIDARLTNQFNDSALTITTGAGAVNGGQNGVLARNYGTGALSITTEGDVTGTSLFGIHAFVTGGTNASAITITTGAGAVTGGQAGVYARNEGLGALTITTEGAVTGTATNGIYAIINPSANASELSIATGAGAVTGGQNGIRAVHYGTGALTITTEGDVTGTIGNGIYAMVYNAANASDLSITTGAGAVTGGQHGILARHFGIGDLTITTEGDVTGTDVFGVYALLGNAYNASDLSVTTGAGAVTGGQDGIRARHTGTGAVTITTEGDVAGTTGNGIDARLTNQFNDSALTITTGAGAVNGGQNGVLARNYGTGALSITTEGDVTGTSLFGIHAFVTGGTNASAITITTGAGAVTGGQAGVYARNEGLGALTITTEGAVTGTATNGIYAIINPSANASELSIATGAGAVTGGQNGIRAVHYGTGALTITTEGDVTGTIGNGIYAMVYNAANASDLSITTGAGAVTGGQHGILARHFGIGDLTITTEGDVTGTDVFGVYALLGNAYNASDLSVTTGAGAVTGGQDGIRARHYGTGALTITTEGNVTGTDRFGINALMFNTANASDLGIATGAGAVTGGIVGIYSLHYGTGALTITTEGDVTGTTQFGIYARLDNVANASDLSITTGAGIVTGGYSGILARHFGTGDLTITTEGDVTGTDLYGVSAFATNSTNAAGISITTGAGAVTGGQSGVVAAHVGTGALTITTEGDVTGTSRYGIFARLTNAANDAALSITTGAGTVSGYIDAVRAVNSGTGALTITTEGDVTGTIGNGIYAQAYNAANSSDISITTGDITNSGRVSALQTLTVAANTLNQNGGRLAATNARLTLSGTLANLGFLTARQQLDIAAAQIDNRGTLGAQGAVNLTAVNGINNAADTLLFSGGDLTLRGNSFSNLYGDVYTKGNLTFAAVNGARAAGFSNLSGTVESEGNIGINAAFVENAKAEFELGQTVTTGSLNWQCGQ